MKEFGGPGALSDEGMSTNCPGFETLSRFADGALGELEEGELLAHVAGCADCRATLASIDQVDGLLTMSLPASGAASRRFRLLRPALLPLAGALLFGVTLGYVLLTPSGAADSPMAVAEMTPTEALPPAEPVADVFLNEGFHGALLSAAWKDTDAGTSSLTEVQGRRLLVLSALPGAKKRWGLVTSASDFTAGEGVSVDVDYRIPKPQKGGRMQVLLQSRVPKSARGVIRWSRTFEEELLEVQTDGRSRPVVLWSSKASPSDADWHQLNVSLRGTEIVLRRDGGEVVRKPHGLSLERVALTLGSTMDKRSRDLHDPFECHVGRVLVRRERAQ